MLLALLLALPLCAAPSPRALRLVENAPPRAREPLRLFLERTTVPEARALAYVEAFVAMADETAGPEKRAEAGRLLASLEAGIPAEERAPLKKPTEYVRAALARAEAGLAGFSGQDAADAAAVYAELHPAPPAEDVMDFELPFLREAEKTLELAPNGTVRFLPETGSPHVDSYYAVSKAALLLRSDPAGNVIRGADRALLERMRDIHAKTRAVLFSETNDLANTVTFTEPVAGGKTMTIAEFVSTERFKTPKWWTWSSQHTKDAPQGYAAITAATTRSLSLVHLGPAGFSTIYWSAGPDGRPDPNGLRLRVNQESRGGIGVERTIEVLAPVGKRDDGSTKWKGFVFTRVGSEWVPGTPARQEKAHRCSNCHYEVTEGGEKRAFPLPAFLKTRAEFLQVGYKPTPLLDAYLKMLLPR